MKPHNYSQGCWKVIAHAMDDEETSMHILSLGINSNSKDGSWDCLIYFQNSQVEKPIALLE